ncbi:MAG TPA: nucleoside deaminase [Candidatus Azoamicus sp.]
MDDNFWMARALLIANKALSIGEIPIAAILIHNDFEVAYCLNSCYISNFCHAENNIFLKSCFYLSKNFLNECTLYVTLEPCFICYSFICYYRVKKLTFAAYSGEINNYNELNVKKGVLEKESLYILKKFFKI